MNTTINTQTTVGWDFPLGYYGILFLGPKKMIFFLIQKKARIPSNWIQYLSFSFLSFLLSSNYFALCPCQLDQNQASYTESVETNPSSLLERVIDCPHPLLFQKANSFAKASFKRPPSVRKNWYLSKTVSFNTSHLKE